MKAPGNPPGSFGIPGESRLGIRTATKGNTMANTASRIEYIDLAKGLCILLVVYFHAASFVSVSSGLDKMMRSFRMPLYFFLSGFFFQILRKFPRIPDTENEPTPHSLCIFLLDNFGHPALYFLGILRTHHQHRGRNRLPLGVPLPGIFSQYPDMVPLVPVPREPCILRMPCSRLSERAWTRKNGKSSNKHPLPAARSGGFHLPIFQIRPPCLPRRNLGSHALLLHRIPTPETIPFSPKRFPGFREANSRDHPPCLAAGRLHLRHDGFQTRKLPAALWVKYTCGICGTLMVILIAKVLKKLPLVSYFGHYSIMILCTHTLIIQIVVTPRNK